jgi:sec-independent protein translocase protein TatC
VTLGIGEPFTTTITVTLLFALVISLPVILFEMYGFVLPAFSPRERRIAMPLLAAIPFLFVIGVAFGYFVVLPAALRFFQNFNSSEFNVLVQAAPYYKFVATILLAMGLVFQVPVAILAATRVGIVTPKQLRHNRRYAVLACAAMAAFLPGDAVTLILETIPLYILYELSILVASIVARRDAKRERAEAARGTAAGGGPAPGGASGPGGVAPTAPMPPSPQGPGQAAAAPSAVVSSGGAGSVGSGGGAATPGAQASGNDDEVEPDVKQIIDHIDRELS